MHIVLSYESIEIIILIFVNIIFFISPFYLHMFNKPFYMLGSGFMISFLLSHICLYDF